MPEHLGYLQGNSQLHVGIQIRDIYLSLNICANNFETDRVNFLRVTSDIMNREQLIASRGGHRSSAKRIAANGVAELENTEKTDTKLLRTFYEKLEEKILLLKRMDVQISEILEEHEIE